MPQFAIIPRATLIFRPDPPDPSKSIIRVAPSETPIMVDSWLQEDEGFQLAVKDGSVIVPADKDAAPTSSQLDKASHLVLAKAIEAKGFAVQVVDPATDRVVYESGSGVNVQDKAPEASSAGTGATGGMAGLGSSPATPSPAGKKAAADQDARAAAANAQNAGASAPDTANVMTSKTGDEKTARPDAPTAADLAGKPASTGANTPKVDDKVKDSTSTK